MRHEHYQPGRGGTPACGAEPFRQTESGGYLVRVETSTTDVRKVTCPDCRRWLVQEVCKFTEQGDATV